MRTSMSFQFIALFFVCAAIVACSSKEDTVTTEYNELYRIDVNGKYGFINENGKLVIEPQFDDAYIIFCDSVCYAKVGERKGLINTNGDFFVEIDSCINAVYWFYNDVAIFTIQSGNQGIIHKSGEIILNASYKNISNDGDNGFIVEDTLGNCGYVDYHGEFILPCKYKALSGFNEGLMMVAASNKCGYVDTTGTWVIDSIYDEAKGFSEGLARVRIKDKWKFIDHEGKVVDKFDNNEILTGFACNRAFVRNGDRIELINKKGKQVSYVDVDAVNGFKNGYATFLKNGKCGLVDTTGTISIPPKFDGLYDVVSGLSVFKKADKYGVINTTGDVVVDAKFDAILYKEEFSLLLCLKENRNTLLITYYDKKGNLIWDDVESKFLLPEKPAKKDYIAYFDSRLSELDPIEGIYYVTFNRIAVDRDNDHISSNGSTSQFYAVMRQKNTGDFIAYDLDEEKPGYYWVKKFVQIGESNTYAVVNSSAVGNSTWSEDGTLVLEDQNKFEVTLRTGGNNYYNWYVRCEFIKDYPSAAEYEKIQKAEWAGTGFAIADGFIVTNYHVTNGARTIKVKGVNGEMKEAYKGYVVASDREHDLAIIRIVDKKFDGFEDIPYCIGKNIPEVGEDIFVLGYPLVETMGEEIKLTNGIISAASGYKGDESMYQISAPIQQGNSGGPLFDKDGNVIGVVCAKHTDAENAGYAIKVSYLYHLVVNSGIGIKLANNSKMGSGSLSKKVKLAKPFVYRIECSSH